MQSIPVSDQRRETPDGRAPGGEQHAGENLDPGFWPNLDPDPVPDPDPGLYSIRHENPRVYFL